MTTHRDCETARPSAGPTTSAQPEASQPQTVSPGVADSRDPEDTEGRTGGYTTGAPSAGVSVLNVRSWDSGSADGFTATGTNGVTSGAGTSLSSSATGPGESDGPRILPGGRLPGVGVDGAGGVTDAAGSAGLAGSMGAGGDDGGGGGADGASVPVPPPPADVAAPVDTAVLDPDPYDDPPGLSWDEPAWTTALVRARRAGRAYVYLNLIEQRLRDLVREVLQPVYGSPDSHDDGAWVAAAAGPAQAEWVERAFAVREMSRRRGYIVDPGDDDLTAFLTLPQLRELLVRNWWCFAPHLSDRKTLERALEELEIGRHIVARNRVLPQDVLAQVERACVRVLTQLEGGLDTPHEPAADDDGSGRLALDAVEELFAGRYSDVVGVFTDRAELQRRLPFADLVGQANSLDACGIALNLLCQNFSGRELVRLGGAGCTMRLLFLNPSAEAMKRRERDEGVKRGLLSRAVTLNILHARRMRSRLPDPSLMQIRVYDDTPRVCSYLVDDTSALVQPYLRQQRGVESPAFVLRQGEGRGLLDVFREEFESLWQGARDTA